MSSRYDKGHPEPPNPDAPPLSLALVHLQAIWYKLPWLLITIGIAGLLEILGWAGRLWNGLAPRILDA